MVLSDIINNGLNNPDCSFFTGMYMGQLFAFQTLFFMLVIYFVFKLIDKLAFEPFINWFKDKYYNNGIIIIKKKKS